MEKLAELSKEQLIRKLQLATDMAMAVDGIWFMAVEQDKGFDAALDMDINVWKRYPSVLLKRIRKYYSMDEKGMEGFKKALRLDPLWLSTQIQIVEDEPDHMVIIVNRCSSLEAMERLNRKIYTCERVEIAVFTALAELFDSHIKVEPIKLPPRASTADICCKWKFYLDKHD